MFTAMIAPHLRTSAGKKAALFGAVAAVALAPFMPIGLPILISALGMLFGISPTTSEQTVATDGAP
jgi:predicted branched-subunit amino acid permease